MYWSLQAYVYIRACRDMYVFVLVGVFMYW